MWITELLWTLTTCSSLLRKDERKTTRRRSSQRQHDQAGTQRRCEDSLDPLYLFHVCMCEGKWKCVRQWWYYCMLCSSCMERGNGRLSWHGSALHLLSPTLLTVSPCSERLSRLWSERIWMRGYTHYVHTPRRRMMRLTCVPESNE